MFSMPFMPGALSAQTPAPAGSVHDSDGVDRLLALFDGAQDGFSTELQSLLHQMEPLMLQRLESMLAGGMTLPKAARQLLSEAVAEHQSGAARLVRAGMETTSAVPDRSDPMAVNIRHDATGGRESPRILLPVNVTAAVPAASPTTSLLVPVQPNASLPGQSIALPPQLATSLLDMGVPQPVGGKDWQGAIAERVVWMTQGEQQFARLTLNPPNLGPLEVRVSVSQDQTSVHFLAGHAAVRDALEAAIPRLRDLFDQQSMSLVHAEVSDPGTRQDRHSGAAARGSVPGAGADGESWMAQDSADETPGRPIALGRGLIDLFV